MKVKPVRSENDYRQALRRIEELWGSPIGSSAGDELDVLVTLAEVFEREHYPVDLPDPLEAIKFRLEQKGIDSSALIGVIGGRTRVYEVMRGDRPLSLNMIRRLHQELQIPADVLIQPARKPLVRQNHGSKRKKRLVRLQQPPRILTRRS